MKNNNETGHTKKVANFEKLVAISLSFCEKYNPSAEAIQTTNMHAKGTKKCFGHQWIQNTN